jgi:FAD/FMN-containing dehydrogenase
VIPRFAAIEPEAHIECGSPGEVAEALAYAQRSGLPVAVRSGGHDFAGRSVTDGVVIDVTPLRGVSHADGIAIVGAGARLGDLYDALDPYTVPAGCGPTVGIAGLVLGGGFGILGRAHGLACDALVGAQVVLADGRVVECDETQEPELFWALRGAGSGSLGVVTRLRLRTLRAPEVSSCELHRPLEEAAGVIETWQAWAPDAPDGAVVSLIVDDAGVHVLGTTTEDVDLPWPVRWRRGPFRETKRLLAERGEPEVDTWSRSEFFAGPLPRETIEELLALREGELDFTPWGGAYTRVPAGATAFVHRDARFLLKQTAGAPGGWLDRSWELVHPFGTGGVYPNFPDPGLTDPDGAYFGANRDRVAAARAAYDPEAVFQPLPYGST